MTGRVARKVIKAGSIPATDVHLQQTYRSCTDGELIRVAARFRDVGAPAGEEKVIDEIEDELQRRADLAYQLADAWARSVPGTPYGVTEPVKAVQHG